MAGVLIEAARLGGFGPDGERSEVIKALLLTGAVEEEVPGVGADDGILVQIVESFACGGANSLRAPFFLGHVHHFPG